jgi:hypothetical protein
VALALGKDLRFCQHRSSPKSLWFMAAVLFFVRIRLLAQIMVFHAKAAILFCRPASNSAFNPDAFGAG